MNSVFANLPVSVFEVMSRLAREQDAVNLGQGFPDGPFPEDVLAKAADAVVNGWNQYPPMMGLPELRKAVSAHYKHWQNLDFDPDSEIMITSGATEAIAGALMALIEPGDEVVLFQPLYDAYLPLVQRAGGVPRFVRLEPPHWRFSEEQLARAFTPKTRVVLFNNPLNPSATVFPREDLELLARYCEKFDAIAVCDEVWEHVMFDGRRHVPLIAMPGMRERCVKIGSAGKIFSLTGWKVGFVCAAPNVLRVLAKAHQYITFTTPPNLQAAVAYGLGKTDDYFETHARRSAAQPRPLHQRAALARLSGDRGGGDLFRQCRSRLARPERGRRDVLQAPRARAQGRGDPGLGVLRQRSDPLGGALLLRQARRDARCRAGAARRRAQAGGVATSC